MKPRGTGNHRVFLSLGSNLGDRHLNLTQALRSLQGFSVKIRSVSSLYSTQPVEVVEQPYFLNLACEIETDLHPEQLLSICLEIEQQMGRVRTTRRGPRLIDIDIIYMGKKRINTSRLTVPHPRRLHRRFVLEPIAEIAPGFRDPETDKTIVELLRRCSDPARVEKSGKLEEEIWK